MAIQTVTNANLAEYVASRPDVPNITNSEQLVAAVSKPEPAKEAGKTDSPIVATGEERSPDAPPEPQSDSQPEKKPKKDVQERINELTRLRKEAEEFAEDEYNARLRAERRIGELESQLNTKPAEQPKQEETLKRPSPKDFQTQDEYDRAMEAYDSERDRRIAAKVESETRARIAMEQQNAAMVERVKKARETITDFDEVITAADRSKATVPPHIGAAILESEYGPHIAYHLAKNTEDQRRIFAMPPAKALLELGKLEIQFSNSGAAPVATDNTPTIETTRAPAPVSALKAETGSVPSDTTKPMPFREYQRLRMEQKRQNRR